MNSNTPFTKDKNKLILSKKTMSHLLKYQKYSIPLQFQILKEERKIFHMKIILYLNGY